MAHPGLGIPNEVLVDLASQGLDGVEAFHSSHKPSLVKKYLHLADQLGLMVTGGSDCHGPMPGGMRMGKTRQSLLFGALPGKADIKWASTNVDGMDYL